MPLSVTPNGSYTADSSAARTPLTQVPVLMAAVVAALRTALRIQVTYGPNTAQIEDETLSVALGDENSVAGMQSTRTLQPGVRRRSAEEFTLACWLSVVIGDDDDDAVQRAVERAADLLEAVAAALNDPALQALAERLEVGPELSWLPSRSERGSGCGIAFEITGTALLGPR